MVCGNHISTISISIKSDPINAIVDINGICHDQLLGIQHNIILSDVSPATDGDGYIVSFCLYRDDLKILSINCSGKARILKTEYTYPGKNAVVPPHTPFSEILAAENDGPVSPDDMDDRQEYALALDGTLYDLMPMLDDIGIYPTFTASMDSDYCTVRTCNGERYVIMKLKCPAIDDSYHLVEVYVKEGDPVINGTVTELSERIVELIVDEQTDTDE